MLYRSEPSPARLTKIFVCCPQASASASINSSGPLSFSIRAAKPKVILSSGWHGAWPSPLENSCDMMGRTESDRHEGSLSRHSSISLGERAATSEHNGSTEV